MGKVTYLCPRCKTVLNLTVEEFQSIEEGKQFFGAVHSHSACRKDPYYRKPDDYILLPCS